MLTVYTQYIDKYRQSPIGPIGPVGPIVQLVGHLYRELEVPASILAGADSDSCEDLWSSRTRYLQSWKILDHIGGQSTSAQSVPTRQPRKTLAHSKG
jgi:hypothetical protein